MTRTVFRHALSALAAAALVSMVASGAIAGETMDKMGVQHAEQALLPLNMVIGGQRLETKKPPVGLTAEKGPRAITSIVSGFNSVNR